jgi:hypothetical protein
MWSQAIITTGPRTLAWIYIREFLKASRFRERQTAGWNFLGKIFVERFRLIFSFLRRKNNYALQF